MFSFVAFAVVVSSCYLDARVSSALQARDDINRHSGAKSLAPVWPLPWPHLSFLALDYVKSSRKKRSPRPSRPGAVMLRCLPLWVAGGGPCFGETLLRYLELFRQLLGAVAADEAAPLD